MIKAVLIDIDDTLLDFDLCADWSIQKAAEELHVKFPQDYFPYFRNVTDGLWKEIEKGNLTHAQLCIQRWNLVFEKFHITCESDLFERYYRKYLAQSSMHVKGAEEVLAYLASKYDVYTASNGPLHQQTQRLQLSGLSQYIQANFISEKIGYTKPREEYFAYCLAHMKDVKKEEVIMIGDSLTADMQGAHNFGIQCIWYNRLQEEVETTCADYVINHMIEIKNIL